MLTITIQVNAPEGAAQGVKETLAMWLERSMVVVFRPKMEMLEGME